MKVLVTGATGFIGSHIARQLVKEGCEVYAVVRDRSNLWRLNDILPQLQVVNCDLSDFDRRDRYLAEIQPELCIHAAWYVVPGKYLTSPDNLMQLNASLTLAWRLAELGCRRFVGIGTCFEYDTALGYLSEDSHTHPRSLYAASKLAVKEVLEQIANLTQMEVAWLRLFYQYGSFDDERRVIPSIICSLLRGQTAKLTLGEQIRDFLHVEDVATAVWAVAKSQESGVFNIASGKPVSVREVAMTIGSLLDRTDSIALGALPYSPSDPMFVCANNHRLIETGWMPHYSLKQGLQETISWWQHHLKL